MTSKNSSCSVSNLKMTLCAAAAVAPLLLLSASPAAANCTPVSPVAGDTVTCAPGNYIELIYNVDDLTLVVDNASNSSVLNGAIQDAIDLQGSGSQTIQIVNSSTRIYAYYGRGIHIQSGGGVGDITVENAGRIDGDDEGVRIVGGAIGNINVTNTGFITGGLSSNNGAGVRIISGQQTSDITINNTGTLRGELSPGLTISQRGTGDVTVNSTGEIRRTGSGRTLEVVFSGQLYGNYTMGSMDISVNDVLGSNNPDAIYLRTGTSSAFYAGGVSLEHTGTNNTPIRVQTGNVTSTSTSSSNGIDISTAASGLIEIRVSGAVEGSRFGIVTDKAGGSTTLRLFGGSSVTGGTAAIRTSGTNVADRIFSSATITGDVLTLSGNDTFVHQSGNNIGAAYRIDLGTGNDIFDMDTNFFGLGADVRGGLGTDTFLLGAGAGTWNQSGFTNSQVRQFEIIDTQSGTDWTLSGTHFNYQNTYINNLATLTLDNGARLFSDVVEVRPGGTLDLGDGSSLNRTLVTVAGDMEIGGAGTTGATSVQGTLSMASTGSLNFDATASGNNDLLRLTGAFANQGTINLDGTLNLNQTYALSAGNYTIINAVQALNGTFATVNGLGSGSGLSQRVDYNLTQNRVRIFTEANAMAPEDTGSKSSASAANYLLSQLGSSSEYAEIGWNMGVMGTTAEIGEFAAGLTPDILDSAVIIGDGAAMRFGQSLAGCDMNFSLNSAESCASVAGKDGPALFGGIQMTSANTGTEVGHNFNAQSFDMNVGVRLTDADDAVQFGLMSGYAKSGSVGDAYYAPSGNSNTPLTPAQEGAQGDSPWIPSFDGMSGGERGAQPVDGLQAETFSFGGYARRDLGWWSLDGTAMVSTSEAKLVRNITPGLGIAEQGTSEFVSRQFNLQGTATLNGLGSSEFWVKPLATVGNRTLQRDGFTERGADLLGLTVDGQTRNVSYAGLGAEIVPDFTDEQGNGFRGLVRVTGLAYAGDTENDFTARFTNAPGDSSFTYFGQNLDTSVLLEGGFQYIAGDGFAIGAEGFGEVNPETGDSSSVGATLQLIKRW